MCPVDLLRASGQNNKLFVVAIDDREKALNTVDLVHKHFPHLKILARAIDRHAYELLRRGVEVVERETFGSAVEMGGGTEVVGRPLLQGASSSPHVQRAR